MPESTEKQPLSYICGYFNPGNFPGWYRFYSRSDGTAATPSNFDSLIDALAEHLKKEENKNRKAVWHNQTPNFFTAPQVEQIEGLLNRHNEAAQGMSAEIIST